MLSVCSKLALDVMHTGLEGAKNFAKLSVHCCDYWSGRGIIFDHGDVDWCNSVPRGEHSCVTILMDKVRYCEILSHLFEGENCFRGWAPVTIMIRFGELEFTE